MKRKGEKYIEELKRLLKFPPYFHFDEKMWGEMKRKLDKIDQSVRGNLQFRNWNILFLIFMVLILFTGILIYRKTMLAEKKMENHLLKFHNTDKSAKEENGIMSSDTIYQHPGK